MKQREAGKIEVTSDVTCPFCGECDFDLIGLKEHLKNYCDVFDKTENLIGSVFK